MMNLTIATMTVKALVNGIKRGEITFDNVVQRGYTWEEDASKGKNQKSLLIDSALRGYPIPFFFCAVDDGKKDCTDGKQRSEAFTSYKDGKFALNGLESIEYVNNNGESVLCDVNGMKYEDLPEELRDRLDDYSLNMFCGTGMTDDEINEVFFRFNNGKALKAAEISWARTKSVDVIDAICLNALFDVMLTSKAKEAKAERVIVMKSWATMVMDEPVWEDKLLAPILQEREITEDESKDLNSVFSYIKDVHDCVSDKKIAKRMYGKTHVSSMIKIMKNALDTGYAPYYTADFITYFFGGEKSTISAEYNKSCQSGSNKKSNVMTRVNILNDEFNRFFDEYDFAAKDKQLKEIADAKAKAEADKKAKEEEKARKKAEREEAKKERELAKKIKEEEKKAKAEAKKAKELANALKTKEEAEKIIENANREDLEKAKQKIADDEAKLQELVNNDINAPESVDISVNTFNNILSDIKKRRDDDNDLMLNDDLEDGFVGDSETIFEDVVA